MLYGPAPLSANHEAVMELQQWLDRELPDLYSRYCVPDGYGLVFAIGPGMGRRAGLISGQESNVSSIKASGGRRYSFFREPYFRESHSMSCLEARKLGVLEDIPVEPAWICVLATDLHLLSAFRGKYRSYTEEVETRILEEENLTDGDWAMAWGSLGSLVILEPVYASIDLKLMHLQRREALAGAIIKACIKDTKGQPEALRVLREETDRAWASVYGQRPVE